MKQEIIYGSTYIVEGRELRLYNGIHSEYGCGGNIKSLFVYISNLGFWGVWIFFETDLRFYRIHG